MSIKEGQRAVYQEHRIEGLQGRFNLGHHAILQFPEKGGPFHVNTSPFHFGRVKPDPFSDPLARVYGALKKGARFYSLDKVPLANGGTTSLNDPRILPSILFWISNGGRHGAPWKGRHLGRLGLEEVCGHYSDGLEISRKNLLKAHGVPTTLAFKAKEAKSIHNIHLVHPVGKGFGRVERIDKDANGTHIMMTNSKGRTARAPMDWGFLHG